MMTGSHRQGNSSSPSINPSEPALKLYLFAKIAPTLSLSRRQCWPQLPQFASLRWALLLAVLAQEAHVVYWVYLVLPITLELSRERAQQLLPLQPPGFKFLLPFRKGVSFLQDPTVIHWKDGNNFKLPGLYKLY